MEKLLSSDPRCKESDLWLILRFWKEEGYKVYIPYEDIDKITPAESITRARRKIQQEGRLLPDNPEVLIKRRIKAQMVREYFSGDKEKLAKWEDLYNSMDHKEGIRRKKYYGGI